MSKSALYGRVHRNAISGTTDGPLFYNCKVIGFDGYNTVRIIAYLGKGETIDKAVFRYGVYRKSGDTFNNTQLDELPDLVGSYRPRSPKFQQFVLSSGKTGSDLFLLLPPKPSDLFKEIDEMRNSVSVISGVRSDQETTTKHYDKSEMAKTSYQNRMVHFDCLEGFLERAKKLGYGAGT